MERFSTLTDQEIYQTILGMPSKSCERDTISSTFPTEVLKCYLPSIAKIINLSLGTGEFLKDGNLQWCGHLSKQSAKGWLKQITDQSAIYLYLQNNSKMYPQSTNHTL